MYMQQLACTQKGEIMPTSCKSGKRLPRDGSVVPPMPARCGTTRMRTQGGSPGVVAPSAFHATVGEVCLVRRAVSA